MGLLLMCRLFLDGFIFRMKRAALKQINLDNKVNQSPLTQSSMKTIHWLLFCVD